MNDTACTCGHKRMFCHKANAQKWCGAVLAEGGCSMCAWSAGELQTAQELLVDTEGRFAEALRLLRHMHDSTNSHGRYCGCTDCLATTKFLIDNGALQNCSDCDGRGFYTGWPHTSCPTCKGTGTHAEESA